MALLYALSGKGQRAFWRWLVEITAPYFPIYRIGPVYFACLTSTVILHKVWTYFEAKLGFMMALFNILVQWYGFQPDENGFFPLSIAEFSL